MHLNLGPVPKRPEPVTVLHPMHLVLTVCTFGVWGAVWLGAIALADAENRDNWNRYERELSNYLYTAGRVKHL